ncbi:MAG TPA: hypothetical protein VK272_10555 [Solirubrobacteraceae bacterium]|nr:hypothetical protein [Solirubrobacteraceae bacterium]
MTKAGIQARRTLLLVAIVTGIVAMVVLAVSIASAGAASSIEGVWAFDNGQIAITPSSNGTFVGTVVDETKFAECAHPVGQTIWTGIIPQPDGSYWGRHQWYFEGTCAENPTPGPTAWRVREEADGSKYLRVCFSQPGTSQPTIPANGLEANVTYECIDSALTAPLPIVAAAGVAGEHLSLPSAKRCLSARLFKIHLLEPKYDPFKKVLVTIRGRRTATSRRGDYVVATIDLKGFPRGAFTVKIRATTVLGHHLSSARTYHTCAKRPIGRKPGKLR